MNNKNIGFLHTGAMGITLAATAQNSGYTAHWLSTDRGIASRQRAEAYGLTEQTSLAELCATCNIIISVCPPHAAADVADQVMACGFTGLYADVNAISPQQVNQIAARMQQAAISFVDGGIIGPPAKKPGTTMLYLSGQQATTVADCFAAGPLGVAVIGEEIGKASALKMCYAANTKGTTALLAAILATAEQHGVREALLEHWNHQNPEFVDNALNGISKAAIKAWRFSGEMEQIAATFESAGLPPGFHLAARDIYQRLDRFKDYDANPDLTEILQALLGRGNC